MPPTRKKPTKPAETRGRGQPTQYRPEHCEKLVEHMRGGGSFQTFAAKIGERGVNRETLYEWARVHPEFSDAKKRGQDASELFWEELGRAGIAGQLKRTASELYNQDGSVKKRRFAPAQFAQSAWGIVMRSRFRYKERIEISTPGDDPEGYEGKSNEDIASDAARLAAELAEIAKRRK